MANRPKANTSKNYVAHPELRQVKIANRRQVELKFLVDASKSHGVSKLGAICTRGRLAQDPVHHLIRIANDFRERVPGMFKRNLIEAILYFDQSTTSST